MASARFSAARCWRNHSAEDSQIGACRGGRPQATYRVITLPQREFAARTRFAASAPSSRCPPPQTPSRRQSPRRLPTAFRGPRRWCCWHLSRRRSAGWPAASSHCENDFQQPLRPGSRCGSSGPWPGRSASASIPFTRQSIFPSFPGRRRNGQAKFLGSRIIRKVGAF